MRAGKQLDVAALCGLIKGETVHLLPCGRGGERGSTGGSSAPAAPDKSTRQYQRVGLKPLQQNMLSSLEGKSSLTDEQRSKLAELRSKATEDTLDAPTALAGEPHHWQWHLQ